MAHAAAREAAEEAGVLGDVHQGRGAWVGRFDYYQRGRKIRCEASVFLMEVREELEQWPEQRRRRRRWLSVERAKEMCKYAWMRDALEEGLCLPAAKGA